jgi:hypothetical protein
MRLPRIYTPAAFPLLHWFLKRNSSSSPSKHSSSC